MEQTEANTEPLMKVGQVADLLNISHDQVYKLARQKKIPSVMVPVNNLRFRPEEIRAVLAKWSAGEPS